MGTQLKKSLKSPKWHWLILGQMGALEDKRPTTFFLDGLMFFHKKLAICKLTLFSISFSSLIGTNILKHNYINLKNASSILPACGHTTQSFNSFLKSFLNCAKPFTTVPSEKTKKNIITSYHLHFSLHFRALCIAHSLCNFQLYFISFCL